MEIVKENFLNFDKMASSALDNRIKIGYNIQQTSVSRQGVLMNNIKDNEIAMWNAAQSQNPARFLELVDENAVMVCGGFRCTGAEYAEIIRNFDIASFEISGFEIVCENEEMLQVHYMIETKVSKVENKDLEGVFHITTTWKNFGSKWKVVFNMDSRSAG